MKHSPLLMVLLTLMVTPSFSQEEGPAVAQSRFEKPNSVIVGGGLSLTFGKNVGDYSRGSAIEASFMHRLNKLVSVGGYVSRVNFNYDPAKSPTSPEQKDLYTGTSDDLQISSSSSETYRDVFSIPSGYNFPHGYQLSFGGGDLSLLTVGGNFRFDLIPYSEKIPVSFFLTARPFIAIANRTEVYGTATRYLFEAYDDGEGGFVTNSGDDNWYADGYFEEWGVQGGFDALKARTNLTAGLQVGPGIEIRPASSVSIFVQGLFGYTLPVSFISTASYPLTLESYLKKTFPMVNKGFPSLGVQAGVGFNF